MVVRFPIGMKLILIIVFLLLLSLGTITVLASVLLGSDARLTAEDANFSVNQQTARGAELALAGVRSRVSVLLGDLALAGPRVSGEPEGAGGPESAGEADYFFSLNGDIAAIASVPEEPGASMELLLNPGFPGGAFGAESLASWINGQRDAVNRAEMGETLLRDGSDFFDHPLLIMLFPFRRPPGFSALSVVVVFFSSETLAGEFGDRENASFLINDGGDILLRPGGEYIWAEAFVRESLESGNRTLQTLYTGEDGKQYFGSFRKLSLANAVVITQVPASRVFAGINAVTRRNIILSAVVLFLSVLFTTLFSRTISMPLRSLARAAELIEEGSYNPPLTIRSGDEIGVLTGSFAAMGHGLENFEKFTNRAIVRLARQGKLTRTGQKKTTTVCFSMIRDFNERWEQFNAGEVVEFVNNYLSRIVPCITETGGVVDKFLTQEGVVVMALWGAAESSGMAERDALNCIGSALMMRAVLWNFNRDVVRLKMKIPGDRRIGERARLIKMGCGINTGEVIVGQMGSRERMEYTVIGDTVNLAARMEGPNDLFDTDILITENTRNLIGHRFVTEEMPRIEVKGKEEALRVFSVINMGDKNESARILAALERISGTAYGRFLVGPEGPMTTEELRERWHMGVREDPAEPGKRVT
jgi:adenylate cyclase